MWTRGIERHARLQLTMILIVISPVCVAATPSSLPTSAAPGPLQTAPPAWAAENAADGATSVDYDGDGAGDQTIFQDGTGYWYAYLDVDGIYYPLSWVAKDTVELGTRIAVDGDGMITYDGVVRDRSGVRAHELSAADRRNAWSDDPAGGGLPQSVVLDRDFWIPATETSMRLWHAIMDRVPDGWPLDGSAPAKPERIGFAPYHWDQDDDARPVVFVSDADALEFARQLDTQVSGGLVRLPSEAEWVHACRAGDEAPFTGGRSQPYDSNTITESTPRSVPDRATPGTLEAGRPYPGLPGIDYRNEARQYDEISLRIPFVYDYRFGHPHFWPGLQPPAGPQPFHRGTGDAQSYHIVPDYFPWDEFNATGVGSRSQSYTMQVVTAEFLPAAVNALGVQDMLGNVAEICLDTWDGRLPPAGLRNEPNDLFRVVRGGSWRDHASAIRVAARSGVMRKTMGQGLHGARTIDHAHAQTGARVTTTLPVNPRCVSDTVGFRFIIEHP